MPAGTVTRDPFAHLTCGFHTQAGDCPHRPKWRITDRLTPDHRELVAAGQGPWLQQYACDDHLRPLLRGEAEDRMYEPLDENTMFGAALLESRIPGRPLSERENWVRARAAVLRRHHVMESYTYAALEWLDDHPRDDHDDSGAERGPS